MVDLPAPLNSFGGTNWRASVNISLHEFVIEVIRDDHFSVFDRDPQVVIVDLMVGKMSHQRKRLIWADVVNVTFPIVGLRGVYKP
jgi:hypothetical protein